MSDAAHRDALEAVGRIVEGGGDADDVLRGVVDTVQERIPHFARVGIAFVEEGRLELGPEAGSGEGEELRALVTFEGAPVAELVVQRTETRDDDAFLAELAALISSFCLVGWDTQGVPWADVS